LLRIEDAVRIVLTLRCDHPTTTLPNSIRKENRKHRPTPPRGVPAPQPDRPAVRPHNLFAHPDLLAFVPRPAYALLLIFPVSETYEKFRRQEDGPKEDYDGAGAGEPVVWYKQTIGNACGLIGLLHGVSNGVARSFIRKSYTERMI